MEQLIAEFRSVIAKGTELIALYNKRLQVLGERKVFLDKLSNDLDAQKHSMEAREAECQKVENAVALHKKATELYTTAQERMAVAVKAENDLAIHANVVKQELDNTRELTRREVAALAKQKKAIDDEVERRLNFILEKMGMKKPAAQQALAAEESKPAEAAAQQAPAAE